MSNFAVIGLGKFGATVAITLFENGAEVLVIDKDEKVVDELKDRVTAAVTMDSTDEYSLKQLGLENMDAVILALGSNIQESILTSALLKKIGVGKIYAKVETHLHGRILEMIGVQNILFPEEMVGVQLAKTLLSRNILEYVNLSSGHIMLEMVAPRSFIGKTLQELSLPMTRGINVIAIKYNKLAVTEEGKNVIERKMNDMPGASDIVNEGDVLILLGPQAKINQLINDTSKERD
ncbi:MAG TPA: TrkA family potassium uptake protein [Candidatus Cloacimonadota bacterium]|nr:TrkA family potassium uptake protein [Candidatus Cloacimonadota bacterium]